MTSTIAQALIPLLPTHEMLHDIRRSENLECARYLFASGVLHGKHIAEATPDRAFEAMEANFITPVKTIEAIFSRNTHARVCVIGSESALEGSYDMAYAGAKAALHLYVQRKRLLPGQQLVCISPSIIGDSGMTRRRTDTETLMHRMRSHPQKRFLTALEVAKMVHFLLYVDRGYTSGVVLRMNGGEHAWR